MAVFSKILLVAATLLVMQSTVQGRKPGRGRGGRKKHVSNGMGVHRETVESPEWTDRLFESPVFEAEAEVEVQPYFKTLDDKGAILETLLLSLPDNVGLYYPNGMCAYLAKIMWVNSGRVPASYKQGVCEGDKPTFKDIVDAGMQIQEEIDALKHFDERYAKGEKLSKEEGLALMRGQVWRTLMAQEILQNEGQPPSRVGYSDNFGPTHWLYPKDENFEAAQVRLGWIAKKYV